MSRNTTPIHPKSESTVPNNSGRKAIRSPTGRHMPGAPNALTRSKVANLSPQVEGRYVYKEKVWQQNSLLVGGQIGRTALNRWLHSRGECFAGEARKRRIGPATSASL